MNFLNQHFELSQKPNCMKKDIYFLCFTWISIITHQLSLKRNFIIWVFMILSFFGLSFVYGQTGDRSTTVWDVDTTISGICKIETNDTLIILPGVTITFVDQNSKLLVRGKIIAVGEKNSPITFTSNNSSGWGGIDINHAKPAEFMHCFFSNINRGYSSSVSESDNPGGIIVTLTDNVQFDSCYYSNNYGGIHIENSSDLVVNHCVFENDSILNKNRGLLYLYNLTTSVIKNCQFLNNVTNRDGIISLDLGSSAVILNNTFSNTKFFEDQSLKGIIYPVVKVESGNDFYTSNVIINNNEFLNSKLPLSSGNEIYEVQLKGNATLVTDAITAFMWNNTFKSSPFDAINRTAIYANKATLTVSHSEFRFYRKSAIVLNYCNAKIHVNTFEFNTTSGGTLRFEEYNNYSSHSIHNEIVGNTFHSNKAINGGGICCLIKSNDSIQTTIGGNNFHQNSTKNGGQGGAVYCANSKNVFFHNNIFEQNISKSEGGAVCCLGTENIEMVNNTFEDNSAAFEGGAIYFLETENIEMLNNTFEYNTATFEGGAVYCENVENIDINFNSFQLNTSITNGGALCLKDLVAPVNLLENSFIENNSGISGGAISAYQSISTVDSVIVSKNIITQNTANQFGGAIAIHSEANLVNNKYRIDNNILNNNVTDDLNSAGGALYLVNVGGVFSQNTISENSALLGGGIYGEGILHSEFSNNCIDNNHAQDGGGIYFKALNSQKLFDTESEDEIVFIDNVIRDNYYLQKGGGCYLENCFKTKFVRNLIGLNISDQPSSHTHLGGGMYVFNSSLEMFNCNIVTNQADSAAIYLDITSVDSLKFINCNVTDHNDAGGLVFKNEIETDKIEIRNCIFYGNNEYSIFYDEGFFANPIHTFYCYFNELTAPNPNLVNAFYQYSGWPGWLGLTDYYLDCADTICVDNGDPASYYYDLFFPPSCGTEINDIGISGGLYAFDNPLLFIPGLSAKEDLIELVEEAIFTLVDEHPKALNSDIKLQNSGYLESPSQINSMSKNDYPDLVVFPNPSKGAITVAFNQCVNSFQVINSYGQEVYSSTNYAHVGIQQINVDLSDMPKGIYYLSYHYEFGEGIEKIILQ